MTLEEKLKEIAKVLAQGIGSFQAGNEAPWDTACEDEEEGRWRIEDANGQYVMEADNGDMFAGDGGWEDDEDAARRHTQGICDVVNLADEVSCALCLRPGLVEVNDETIEKAWEVIVASRNAKAEEQVPT